MNILVTGGLGYIGSHTVVELIEAGHTVSIVDNLCNSTLDNLSNIEKIVHQKITFYEVDLKDYNTLKEVFYRKKFDGVIHFAALKAVEESIRLPLQYYENNIVSTLNLVKLCKEFKVYDIIFSSSATVYGNNLSPLSEDMELLPTSNPYGETKVICEKILTDLCKSDSNFNVTILRYFNPIGAHESGLIGDNPNGIPNNLLPYVAKVAKGTLKELSIFGADYYTADGTGIRDYIHVKDLAIGHVLALEKIKDGLQVYNLGTGNGVSVLEIVNVFQKVNDVKVPFKIVDRRPGDIDISFADVSKANKELGFKTSKSIEEMCKDMWDFERKMNQ